MNWRLHGLVVGVLLCLSLNGSHAQSFPGQATPGTPPVGVNASAPASVIPSDIPVRREAPPQEWSSGRLTLAAWSVLALGVLAWTVLRMRRPGGHAPQAPGSKPFLQRELTRLLGRTTNQELQALESTRLTPHCSVHTVRWNQTEFLLACSENGVTVLAQRPQEIP